MQHPPVEFSRVCFPEPSTYPSGFQNIGVVLACLGFIAAIVSIPGGAHFLSVHAKLGLVVMIMGFLQPLNAAIRCVWVWMWTFVRGWFQRWAF